MSKYEILFNETLTWYITVEADDEDEAFEMFQDMDVDNDIRAKLVDVSSGEYRIKKINEESHE